MQIEGEGKGEEETATALTGEVKDEVDGLAMALSIG